MSTLLLPAGCGKKNEDSGTVSGEIPKVRFITLSETTERNTIEVLGSLMYYEKADVGSKVEGRIAALYIKEGQRVYRNQPLAMIEQLPFKIALQNSRTERIQARNRLNIAKIQLQDAVRNVHKQIAAISKSKAELKEKTLFFKTAQTKLVNATALYKAGGMSKSAYDQAKISVESAKVALTVANKNLKMVEIGFRIEDLQTLGYKGPFNKKKKLNLIIKINTSKERASVTAARNELLKAQNNYKQALMLYRETTIRSPLAGIIAMKGIERGEHARKDSKLFTVMDVSRMYANLNLSEDSLGDIKQRGTIDITVDSLGKKILKGTISLVHPLVDPRTRSVTVKVLLKNYQGLLKPGMFVRAGLKLKKKARAWMLPAGAVMGRNNGKPFVYMLRGRSIFKNPVTTGKVRGDRIEILKGLTLKALVAVPPKNEDEGELSILSDGNPVIPVLPRGIALPEEAPKKKKTKNP